jgi:hypothetical protein
MRPAVLALGIALFCPQFVNADPITVRGEGTLSFACGSCLLEALGSTAAAGDPFTFAMTFDPPATDVDPFDPTFGQYTLTRARSTFSLGSQTFTNTYPYGPPSGYVSNDYVFSGPPFDQLQIFDTDGTILVGFDPLADWLSTDVWPSDIASTLNAAPYLRFIVIDSSRDNSHIAFGTPGRITAGPAHAPVPEPGTLTFLTVGLVGVGVRRWRQRNT